MASAGNKGPAPDRNTSSALLRNLLDIAVAKRAQLAEATMAYISKTADDAVRDALSVMSAADFIAGALTVIETGEASVNLSSATHFIVPSHVFARFWRVLSASSLRNCTTSPRECGKNPGSL